MKKLNRNNGLSLMEVLVCILILSLLIVALGTSMNSALQAYGNATFESGSASLANVINTSLNDVLRYADSISFVDSKLIFTNLEYGLHDAYFHIPSAQGTLNIKASTDSLEDDGTPLVNSGVYSDMGIRDFSVQYVTEDNSNITKADGTVVESSIGGFIYVKYAIASELDPTMIRNVETVIRLTSFN